MSLAPLALVLALLLPLAPPGFPVARAAEAAPVQLEYTIDATDAALRSQGKVQVLWKASGFQGRISAFCLQTDRHEYPLDQGSFGPVPPWEYHPGDVDPPKGKPACGGRPPPNDLGGYRALVSGQDTLEARFTVDVKKPAFTACGCEFNSFLGGDWGVVKGEAFAIPFSYAYFADPVTGLGPSFHATVRFVLPAGWSGEAPWTRLGENHYELPGTGAPLPRGFFVIGTFAPEHRDERASIGKEFVYVRLAQELKTKDSLFEYLKAATPYYQSVYGDVTGDRMLVVSAGPPMFTGGLGSTDSLFVHQNSSAETVAHEYAHVWQRFQTVDDPGQSSLWINEGDADLHGALSRFVTETQPGFGLAELNREFKEDYDKHSQDADYVKTLVQPTYGCAEEQPCNEQVAYKKGLATLVFLDQELRRITEGTANLNDWLRALNVHYDTVVSQQPGEKRLTNEQALEVLNQVVANHTAPPHVDMRNFFQLYVYDAPWPPYREVPAEVPIVLDQLTLDPATAVPGQTVQARVTATNVRDRPESRSLSLVVNGTTVDTRNLTLGALKSAPVSFAFPAPAPGTHPVRVGYLSAELEVLTPPQLAVERIVAVGSPQAGVAFDLAVDLRNSGGAPGEATVDATIGGAVRSTTVEVPGGGTARGRMPFVVAEEGPATARVIVRWSGQSANATQELTIGPRDRDGDGVPDAADAYPEDPRLSEANPINDLRSKTPGFGAGAALAALGAGLVLARRRRR